MNVWLVIAIAIANIGALALIYQFIKKMSKREIITFLAINVASMYILISIVYWLSGLGVDSTVHEAMKDFVIYLFVPVNIILFVPYCAFQYRKFKNKQINVQELSKKLSILVILIIIVLVVEYFYFVNMQNNVKNISTNMSNTTEQNEQTIENEISNNEEIFNVVNTNETQTNIITTN